MEEHATMPSLTTNTKQSKDRASNFSAVEDLMCTIANFRASEDPICGAKQKGNVFKAKIEAAYNQLKDQRHEEEKREAQRPSYLQANGGSGFTPKPYPFRSGTSLHVRFNRTISPTLVKFMSVVKQNNKPKSGEDLGAWKRCLLLLYHERYGSDFKYMQCYDIAKDKPKFLALFGVQDQSNPSVASGGVVGATSSSSTSTSSSEEEDMITPTKRPSLSSVGNKATRPVGTKRAKKMKQEDEMADRMAQRFGIKKTHEEDVNAGNNNRASKALGLHDALALFLAVAGNSMLTWMLQSMSASASEELRRQYADECIRQKILEMKASNNKLELLQEHNKKNPLQDTSYSSGTNSSEEEDVAHNLINIMGTMKNNKNNENNNGDDKDDSSLPSRPPTDEKEGECGRPC